jgi:hypothetical protein
MEQLDDLESRVTDAAVEAVGDRLLQDPDVGSISAGSVEGREAESRAAPRAKTRSGRPRNHGTGDRLRQAER